MRTSPQDEEARLSFPSPLGPLTLVERQGALVALIWRDEGAHDQTPLLLKARDQVDAYFARKLKAFDLPLAPQGSQFQQAVWKELSAIPFGQTKTYGEIAKTIGAMPQAVGQACGENPLPIIIPCHRVLSASGSGGFSAPGGLISKFKLLQLEGAALL